MALLGRSKSLSNIFNKGIIGDVTEGLGIGGLINFVDDRAGGRLKGINIPLGRTVNGQPLTLNLTDVAMALATTGIHIKGNNMLRFAVTLGSKKLGEAFGIIMDDPLPNDGRQQTMLPAIKVGRQEQELLMVAPVTAFGGYNN